MALAGKTISNTYKDMLNINFGTDNEGFTSSAKRLFDGGGTGSPLYLGTSGMEVKGADLKVGTASTESGNYDMYFYANVVTSGSPKTPYGHFDASEGIMRWNDIEFKITGSKGKFITQNVYMQNDSYDSGNNTLALSFSATGEISTNRPFVTKNSVTFKDSSNNTLSLDATTSSFEKPSGGKITFEDDGVKLNKDSTNMATFNDKGPMTLTSQTDLPDGTFGNGALINKGGEIYIRQGE